MIATIVISIVLICIVVSIVTKMVRDKRNGKSGCGCGCDGCANSSLCHGTKKNK